MARQARLRGMSTVYRSAALERPEQPPYFNCVVEMDAEDPPRIFKHTVLRPIEARLGRERAEDKYAARTIDLDLILYDDLVLDGPDIRLPDPDIVRRPFLAIPLFELAPDLVLPGFNQKISEVAGRCSRDSLEPLDAYTLKLRECAGCVGSGRKPPPNGWP